MPKKTDTFCWDIYTAADKKVDLAGIAKGNAMNKTGNLNYNKFGRKDGRGFEECSEMFIDNFLLRTVVPDYLSEKKRCYTRLGSLNKAIREELEEFGIKTFMMKAVNRLYPVEEGITDEMKSRIRERDISLETQETKYFWQDIKVACPNADAKKVLQFLRQRNYKKIKVELKDIDFTIDYAGSFDKDEVIDYMIKTNNFRMQGSDEAVLWRKTIVENDRFVGRNCLTYMDESPEGCSVRCKLYNKMVQMLESKSVASTLGNNWRKWVDQSMKDEKTGDRTDTRLVTAKDKAIDRGLTRAEVTFNCREDIPSDRDIDTVLHQITKFVPNFLVYSTPFSATWIAYCDVFVHSLVVVERGSEVERALVVHSYNEITEKTSGMEIENWDKEWCLANLTLSSHLPLDIIEVNLKEVDEETGKQTHCVTMSRFMKQHTKGQDFKTRLVLPGYMYTTSKHSKEMCDKLLEKSGFIPHKNCIPELANKKGNRNSIAHIQLKFLETLKPKKRRMVRTQESEDHGRLEVIKQTTLDKMAKIREKMSVSARINTDFIDSRIPYKCLKDLSFGHYDVWAVKAYSSKHGVKYTLFLEREGEKMKSASNKHIEGILQRLVPVHIMQLLSTNGILHPRKKDEGPIATLKPTGHGRTRDGSIMVYSQFMLSLQMMDHIKQSRELLQKSTTIGVAVETICDTDKEKMEEEMDDQVKTEDDVDLEVETSGSEEKKSYHDLPIIPRSEMPLYQAIPQLSSLPLKSIYTIMKIGFYNFHSQDRLLVQLDDGHLYVAGNDLEGKKEELHLECKIILEKLRVCQSTRKKYFICTVVKKGDWVGLVKYQDAPALQKRNGFAATTRILDVGYTQHKGKKRKLVLTEEGSVYKIKASRLENEIKPGDFV